MPLVTIEAFFCDVKTLLILFYSSSYLLDHSFIPEEKKEESELQGGFSPSPQIHFSHSDKKNTMAFRILAAARSLMWFGSFLMSKGERFAIKVLNMSLFQTTEVERPKARAI